MVHCIIQTVVRVEKEKLVYTTLILKYVSNCDFYRVKLIFLCKI